MRLLIVGILAALCAPALWGQTGQAEVKAEQRRIAAERARIEAAFKAREAQCAQRFLVTACIDRAKAERRQALLPLDEAQQSLDDAQRRQRTAERLQRLERKQREAAARPPAVEMPEFDEPAAAVAEAASAPASGAERAAPPRGKPARAARAQEAQAAASRASAAQQRQRQADAHREAVEQRNAERRRAGKGAAPLPLPEAASAPRAGSAP